MNREGLRQTVPMRRFIWAFAIRIWHLSAFCLVARHLLKMALTSPGNLMKKGNGGHSNYYVSDLDTVDRGQVTMEPWRQKAYIQTCAHSEDSDQPAHSRSLIRIFTGRILDSQGCEDSSCGQRRLWSDRAEAQSDLSFRWVHKTRGTFFHVTDQLLKPSGDSTKSRCWKAAGEMRDWVQTNEIRRRTWWNNR